MIKSELTASRVEFKIKGMSCSGCASRIQKVLSMKKEIKESSVNYKNKKALIQFDEKRISQEEIKEIINNIGFEVVS